MRYDYYCPKCDKEQYGIEHGMNEKPEIKCNRKGCDGICERLYNSCSFKLNGKDWDSKGRV
jgi:predicted nucleic acid-binding Zn ribbon protein